MKTGPQQPNPLPNSTPAGRGYDESLNYFHHANDYWDQTDGSTCSSTGKGNTSITDLWTNSGPAIGQNNSWECSQSHQLPGCRYEDDIFGDALLAQISAHDPATPMFLFWAPHVAHAPLEVPAAYLEKFSWIDKKTRGTYAAMINFIDTLAGKVVAALQAKGMWDNLLWVSSADNGGPICECFFFFYFVSPTPTTGTSAPS